MRPSELPKDYKKRAKDNNNSQANLEGTPLEGSLTGCFVFYKTPEGHDFWQAVMRAKKEDELPPIPPTPNR